MVAGVLEGGRGFGVQDEFMGEEWLELLMDDLQRLQVVSPLHVLLSVLYNLERC